MKNDFWYLILCLLFIIASYCGMSIWIRIAIALDAIVVLIDVARKIRGIVNGNKETKNDHID